MRGLGAILMFVVGSCLLPMTASPQDKWNATTLNWVRGNVLGVTATYDPGDPLVVSGRLHRNTELTACPSFAGPPETAIDFARVIIHPVTPGSGLDGGHGNCSGEKSFSYLVSPLPSPIGDPGDFSFTLGGGGVSWLNGSGLTTLGAWVEIEFFDTLSVRVGRVACGNADVYEALPGCSASPHIYGEVASPDLNGTGMVDGSDLAVMNSLFLGHPVTLESGWQADFNHVGPNVDASDLAYLAGRMGKLCIEGQQKTGPPSYQMDVENLDREDLRAVMAEHGITVSQILAAWDAMGFSYDREAAATILASEDTKRRDSSWSNVKTLFR